MDRLYLIELFDCYQELLTVREKEYFIDYFEEDLSLSEIAENKKVSRSAVQKVLKKVEDKLLEYEEKLMVLKMKKEIKSLKKDV